MTPSTQILDYADQLHEISSTYLLNMTRLAHEYDWVRCQEAFRLIRANRLLPLLISTASYSQE